MADANSVSLEIRAKNLTQDAFNAVSAALKALEDTAHDTSEGSSIEFGKLFETITGGVTAGELLHDAIEKVGEAAVEAGRELLELTADGSKVSGVEEGFERLAGGVDKATAILAALNQGTKSTIPNLQLMQTANKMLADGANLTAAQFGTLAEGARLLARESGTDTAQALDTLSQAMVTGRARALNLIGVHIDADAAMQHYADTIGKSVTDFTNQDKVAANAAAIMQQLQARVNDAGDAQLTYNERVSQAEKALQDFGEELGKGIATSPVLAAAMDTAGKAIADAFGGSQAALIQNVVHWLENAAIFGLELAKDGVTGVKDLGDAWFGFTTFMGTVAETFVDDQVKMVQSVLKFADSFAPLAKITGQGELFTEMQTLLAGTVSLGQGLSGSLKAGLDNVTASEKTFNTVTGGTLEVLGRTELAAAVAAAAHNDAADAADKHAKRVAEVSDSYEKADPAVQKFENELRILTSNIEGAWVSGMDINDMLKLFGQSAETAALKAQAMGLSVSASIVEMANEWNQHKLSDFVAKDGAAIRTQYDQIMKEAAAAVTAGLKDISKAWDDNEKAIASTQDEAQNLFDQRTMSSYDLAKTQLENWVIDQKSKVDKNTSNWQEAYASIDNDASQKLIDIEAKHKDTLEQMAEQAITYGNIFKGVLQALPGEFAQALSSGSSFSTAMVHAASSAGSAFGSKAFTDIFNKVGGSVAGVFGMGFTSVLGTLMPGIGSAVGSLITPLLSSLFGTAGRDAVTQYANSFLQPGDLAKGISGFDELHEKLQDESVALKTAGYDSEQLWISLTEGVGRNNPQQAQQAIDAIKGALAAADTAASTFNDSLNPLLSQLSGLGGSLSQNLIDELTKTGVLTSQNTSLVAALGATAGPAYQQLTDLQQRYNLTAAQMGPAFEQAADNQGWQQIIDDIQTATDGGLDMNGVLAGMSPTISKLVQDSLAFGTTIPSNMEATVRQLAAQGELLDANGKAITDLSNVNFSGDPIEDSMQKLIDSIQKLVDALTGPQNSVSSALTTIGNTTVHAKVAVDTDWSSYTDGPGAGVSVPGGGDVPEHADGAFLRQDHYAYVHGGEMIGDENFFGPLVESAVSRAMGSGAGGAQTIVVQVDGKTIAKVNAKYQRRVLAPYGAA